MIRPRPPAPREAHESSGELNVVPFLDILLNVLMFVLATIAVTFTTALDATPPAGHGPRPPDPTTLALNVAILHDGFLVSARGQRIGQGCEAPGAGLAVGKTAQGEPDYDGLTTCARRLKTLARDGERDVVITAANDVRYDEVVHTMDALRGGPEGELFPQVSFGVPR
jgi:biopolymer transport protein ExbD